MKPGRSDGLGNRFARLSGEGLAGRSETGASTQQGNLSVASGDTGVARTGRVTVANVEWVTGQPGGTGRHMSLWGGSGGQPSLRRAVVERDLRTHTAKVPFPL